MKIISLLRAGQLAVVLIGGMAAQGASAGISTTGSFTRYFGDVGPVVCDQCNFETFVNDALVPALDPPVDIGGSLQGEFFLPSGTSSVEFKNRQRGLPFNTPNLVAFQGVSTVNMPASISTPFLLGSITVTNGIWFAQANMDITIAVQSDDPAFNGHSFSDTLRYVVTPNTGDNEQNADYLYFDQHPELGQIRVYEASSGLGNTGTVELWGKIGSLDPVYFANASGATFIQAVPEPEVYATLLAGLLVVFASVARARKARA